MQQSILFKVPGKPSSSPLVILTGPTISARYSTPITARLSRTLSMAWESVKCACTRPASLPVYASYAPFRQYSPECTRQPPDLTTHEFFLPSLHS
ncbi:hypothetical protein E7747_07815 [Duncaniella dubosii]|uniref:Uncharacterized protein n=1 Tax=Duncaniella dubosii TaxID=2518971 RepID=A0A4V1D391_9BACT|nr:hypothetical protein [Duncaniella dubosii]QCD42188.1 hypothetical protein E7747_07815 [Duncaniella dubosii]